MHNDRSGNCGRERGGNGCGYGGYLLGDSFNFDRDRTFGHSDCDCNPTSYARSSFRVSGGAGCPGCPGCAFSCCTRSCTTAADQDLI